MVERRPAPLVSVVLPVYNGEAFLAQAIDSILTQTFTDYELIVVDDGSTDRTAAILKRYQDHRLMVIRHARNQGLVDALNTGWRQGRGALIAIMNADDISLPERLAQQVAFLQASPEIGLLGTAIERMNLAGERTGFWPVVTLPGVVGWELFFKAPHAHPTVMLRRSLLEQVDGYRQGAQYVEDFDLWMRLAALTKAANLPTALVRYRIWPGTISAQRRQEAEIQSTAICRMMVSRCLDRDVSLREAGMLRRLDNRAAGEPPTTPEDIRHVAALVDELQRRYVAMTTLTTVERRQIDASVARKLFGLGRCALAIDRVEAAKLILTALRRLPEKRRLISWVWWSLRTRRRNLK